MVFKINCDGVTKGNLGACGFREVYINSKGEILQVYYGSIGFDTKNYVELEGLLRGLGLVLREGWLPAMVEGDSNILIQMEK